MTNKAECIRIAAVATTGLMLGACSADSARPALQQYQCEREAAGRPDAGQRRAECQTRMQTPNTAEGRG